MWREEVTGWLVYSCFGLLGSAWCWRFLNPGNVSSGGVVALSPAPALVEQLFWHHSSQWLGDRRKPGWGRMLKPFQKPLERKLVIFCFPEWFH